MYFAFNLCSGLMINFQQDLFLPKSTQRLPAVLHGQRRDLTVLQLPERRRVNDSQHPILGLFSADRRYFTARCYSTSSALNYQSAMTSLQNYHEFEISPVPRFELSTQTLYVYIVQVFKRLN